MPTAPRSALPLQRALLLGALYASTGCGSALSQCRDGRLESCVSGYRQTASGDERRELVAAYDRGLTRRCETLGSCETLVAQLLGLDLYQGVQFDPELPRGAFPPDDARAMQVLERSCRTDWKSCAVLAALRLSFEDAPTDPREALALVRPLTEAECAGVQNNPRCSASYARRMFAEAPLTVFELLDEPRRRRAANVWLQRAEQLEGAGNTATAVDALLVASAAVSARNRLENGMRLGPALIDPVATAFRPRIERLWPHAVEAEDARGNTLVALARARTLLALHSTPALVTSMQTIAARMADRLEARAAQSTEARVQTFYRRMVGWVLNGNPLPAWVEVGAPVSVGQMTFYVQPSEACPVLSYALAEAQPEELRPVVGPIPVTVTAARCTATTTREWNDIETVRTGSHTELGAITTSSTYTFHMTGCGPGGRFGCGGSDTTMTQGPSRTVEDTMQVPVRRREYDLSVQAMIHVAAPSGERTFPVSDSQHGRQTLRDSGSWTIPTTEEMVRAARAFWQTVREDPALGGAARIDAQGSAQASLAESRAAAQRGATDARDAWLLDYARRSGPALDPNELRPIAEPLGLLPTDVGRLSTVSGPSDLSYLLR